LTNKFFKVIRVLFGRLQNDNLQIKIKRLNVILCFFSLIFVFKYFSELNFNSYSISISWEPIAVGTFFYISNIYLWKLFMKENYEISLKDFIGNWSISKIGKYFPTGILAISARLNQKLRTGQNSQKIFYGLLEEHFAFSLIGLFSASIMLLIPSRNFKFILFPLVVFLVITLFRLIYFKFDLEFVSFLNFKYSLILHINLNFLFVFFVANNVYQQNAFNISILYFLSLCIGLFFVGVPAGIGIREAIFIFLLGSTKLEIFEMEFLINIRIILLFLDLLFFLFGLIFSNSSENKIE